MRLGLLSLLSLLAALMLPMGAQAITTAGELGPICDASSPVCRAYVLGGAERFWLLRSKHEDCKAETDLKAIDDLLGGVAGKENPFSKKGKDMPAPFALLEYINDKKLELCSLGMKNSELLSQCDSKEEKDQYLCQAYISGVLDMALAVNDLKAKQNGDEETKPLFCTSMNPPVGKMEMKEGEIMTAIQEWRKARPDRPSKTPAAQEIINALVIKYPCQKDNILTEPKAKKAAKESSQPAKKK